MDFLADDFVKNHLESGEKKEFGTRLKELFSGRVFSKIIDSELEDKVLNLPVWINFERIKAGQKVFTKYGPEISMLLMFKSLPECYACGNGVNVLYQTGKFTYDDDARLFSKRLLDTTKFVHDVLREGSFEGDKVGLKSILKIRTIHATARYMVNRKGDWNAEKYGMPINQEDMLGTLMAFSQSVIEGLEKLGTGITEKEKEDYYYVWRVAGQALGIQPEMIPINAEEAFELSNCIIAHQLDSTEEGRILTESILKFVNDKIMFPGFKGGAEEIMRYLVDRKIVEAVAITESKSCVVKFVPRLLKLTTMLRHSFKKSKHYSKFTQFWNRIMLDLTVQYLSFLGKGKKHIFDFS